MTTQSENDNTITVIPKLSIDGSEKIQEELTPSDENESKNNSSHEIEEKNNINDDSITTVNNNEEQKEITVNNVHDDHRSKRPFYSKAKYSSMAYHRSAYYPNGHPYGPAPYYYYQVAPVHEKPTPLMVVPTQPSTSTTDNPTGNSTTNSPQNLPPRLRQISTNENESNLQQSSSAQISITSTAQPTITNGRRQRSILPRTSCNYYFPHPPPPLMATPPGVLFPYQPGHIAYNIRTPDELEILAFQQQFMNLPPPPPPLIWPPSTTYPSFSSYPMYAPSPYMYNNSSTINSNSSLLNPEAAEWVPLHTDNDTSSSDNNILIDDEINFPPLNNNRTEENNSEQKPQIDSVPHADSTNTTADNTTPSPSKTDSVNPNSSSNQDDNKHLSSPSKLTTITYSTVILQTPDTTKSNKKANTYTQSQRQNHVHTQLPTKQRTQIRVSKELTSRRRQPPSNRNNFPNVRNSLPTETPKQQQQQSTDDWIEVKSKKTKKYDRSTTDHPYENAANLSQKLVSDEQIDKTFSSPSPLSSAGENTTATCTSEEDDITDNKLVMIVENQTITTTKDYNQIIMDDIHQRLDNKERLLIIMRGCPGSGKSTLAKSLNDGYHGQILSIEEYFRDMNSNEYLFDPSKLDDAHLHHRRLASDAFKRNISPIIIDNTNTTSWEMKPYVAMGKEAGYDILLIEPQTPWRYKARELVKRNLHNLPLRRIKEMLNRFEHNVTVQSIIDQLKTNIFLPCQSQQILDQNQTDNESIDPILTSKKSFDIIDDPNILDDVRLCINDIILFLTSNFYQTSLSISFSDLTLIPSSPASPSTPHSLFHRSLSRFSSTTTNSDHSFSNEHLLRLPTTSFSRCFEKLTPSSSSSTNSSIIGKKRRKNKNKQQQQQQSNEILLNTNNNNNNNNLVHEADCYLQQSTYHVYLPEDSSDFLIIDEQEFDNLTQQGNSSRDHSSTIPQPQKTTHTQKNDLLNIIHDGLTKSSPTTDQRSSVLISHIAIQCSSDDFNQDRNHSDRILIGHLSSMSTSSAPVPPPPGFSERGIQVDSNDNNMDSLSNLTEFYSDCLSSETIKQFYKLCNSDIQWTRIQIDEHLQHNHFPSTILTLRELSFNALNQWNEQIKHSNPSFDTISIGDLLQDITDEEFIVEDEINNNHHAIEFTDSNQMTIPWSMINSLQELYGELPTKSIVSESLSLPLDDELSLSIYQALQRFLGVSNQIIKPVNEKKLTKENKKINKQQQQQQQQQQWISPSQNESNTKSDTPSLREIMSQELDYINSHKQTQKRQLDFASQQKLKALERHFPTIPPDALYDIFITNESDYDLTFVCLSSMLDENVSITTIPKSHPVPPPSASSIHSTITTKSLIEPGSKSFEISRRNARDYALKRKEYLNKADQANRHGMTGVASYYISQAREQTQLIKDANRLACEYLSRTRLMQFRQTHRLDLHELHADEALQLFKQVEQELNEGNKRTTLKSIEIITGYGKNSPYGGGGGKIRSVILAYIRQRNYRYSEPNKGAIIVQL